MSESEPATPEEESDDDFHLDGSPSDDSGSDFEPELSSRKRKATPVKKKPKGAVKKSPKAASSRGRGGGRSSSGRGRSRKEPSPGRSIVVSTTAVNFNKQKLTQAIANCFNNSCNYTTKLFIQRVKLLFINDAAFI